MSQLVWTSDRVAHLGSELGVVAFAIDSRNSDQWRALDLRQSKIIDPNGDNNWRALDLRLPQILAIHRTTLLPTAAACRDWAEAQLDQFPTLHWEHESGSDGVSYYGFEVNDLGRKVGLCRFRVEPTAARFDFTDERLQRSERGFSDLKSALLYAYRYYSSWLKGQERDRRRSETARPAVLPAHPIEDEGWEAVTENDPSHAPCSALKADGMAWQRRWGQSAYRLYRAADDRTARVIAVVLPDLGRRAWVASLGDPYWRAVSRPSLSELIALVNRYAAGWPPDDRADGGVDPANPPPR